MASIDEIAELRRAIKEPDNVEPYTDDELGRLIDTYGINGAAGRVWREKATNVANLVDISEGGSTRKQSQLFDNYSKIALDYETKDLVVDTVVSDAPRSRRAVRV